MCELIKKYEGLKLQAYWDKVGNVWTIGYGTTKMNGSPVKEGEIITKEYAEALLTDYLMKEVDPYIMKIQVQLTPGQKEALRSLVYNWTGHAFLKSSLFAAINKKDWSEVYKQWDFGRTNGLNGLLKRRAEELCLFMRDI